MHAVSRATPEPGAPVDQVAYGFQQFTQNGCVGCHTVAGNDAAIGLVGPNLTHVGSRTTIAAGTLDNTTENLTEWVHDAPSIKPGSKMPSFAHLTDEQVAGLVAYLQSLQ